MPSVSTAELLHPEFWEGAPSFSTTPLDQAEPTLNNGGLHGVRAAGREALVAFARNKDPDAYVMAESAQLDAVLAPVCAEVYHMPFRSVPVGSVAVREVAQVVAEKGAALFSEGATHTVNRRAEFHTTFTYGPKNKPLECWAGTVTAKMKRAKQSGIISPSGSQNRSILMAGKWTYQTPKGNESAMYARVHFLWVPATTYQEWAAGLAKTHI